MMSTLYRAFRTVWRNAYLKLAVALLVVAALLLFLFYTRSIWLIFILALLVAYLAQPLMTWCERHLRARSVGLLAFVLGLFLFAGLTSVLIAGLVTQIAQFSQQLPDLIDRVVATSQMLPESVRNLSLPAALITVLEQAYRNLGALLQGLADNLVNGLGRFVTDGGLVGGVSTLIVDVVRFAAFLVVTLYLLLDLPRVSQSLLAAVPVPYQPLTVDLTAKLERAVGGYFRGQLVIALVVGVLIWLGLELLRVPLAPSLGFLAGTLNLVPYLGPVVSLMPSLLLAAGLGWPQSAGVLVLFAVANQLETHLLSPLILGRATRLHPVTVILAILLGAYLFGLLGAVLAVPVAAFLKLVYEDYYLPSRFHQEG